MTGAGAYAANKKVTLKATANKGNVFAGWYADAESAAEGGGRGATALPVSRLASYVLAMPSDDTTLYAKFVSASEDTDIVLSASNCVSGAESRIVTTNAAVFNTAGALEAESVSVPKIAITGLPAGLKFTDKLVTSKVTTGTGKSKVTTRIHPDLVCRGPRRGGQGLRCGRGIYGLLVGIRNAVSPGGDRRTVTELIDPTPDR